MKLYPTNVSGTARRQHSLLEKLKKTATRLFTNSSETGLNGELGIPSRRMTFVASSLFFGVAAAMLMVGAIVVNLADRAHEREEWKTHETEALAAVRAMLLSHLPEVVRDTRLLAEKAADHVNGPGGWSGLAIEFERFARHHGVYDQLRFIGLKGHEIVRVNYSDGKAVRTETAALQDKSRRPYVVKGLQLGENEIYLSRFDLNVEHGRIETPLRPVLRLVVPVVDRAGAKTGLIVVNLNGRALLAPLAEKDRASPLRYWLMNADGYWLYSGKTEDDWGFQRRHGRHLNEQSKLWHAVREQPNGTVLDDWGLHTYKRIPLNGTALVRRYRGSANSGHPNVKIVSESPWWVLITSASFEDIYNSARRRLEIIAGVLFVLLFTLVPVSLAWGQARARSAAEAYRARIYARVVEQSAEMIYVTAQDGAILFANPEAQRVSGYTQEELVGRHARIFKSGRHDQAYYDTLWNTISSGKPFSNVIINRRKDGNLFHQRTLISPLFDDHGKLSHFVSTGRDITAERQKVERELRSAEQVAAQLRHHFNNLLTPIIGYARMASAEASENRQTEILANLEKAMGAVSRLQGVVARIGSMSVGREMAAHSEAALPLITKFIDEERRKLPPGIELSLSYGPDVAGVEIACSDLPFLLKELIGNASDAIGAKGCIDVSVQPVLMVGDKICRTCGEPLSGRLIDIAVSDTGTGMTPDVLEKAFDPFYSANDNKDLVGKALGVGLTGVRNSVHADGGHIIVDTEPGKGTTMHLYFSARDMN